MPGLAVRGSVPKLQKSQLPTLLVSPLSLRLGPSIAAGACSFPHALPKAMEL